MVQGDRDLGLGCGFDHEVWVALVAVVLKRARQDPEVFRTGLIQDVPVREIVREMGWGACPGGIVRPRGLSCDRLSGCRASAPRLRGRARRP